MNLNLDIGDKVSIDIKKIFLISILCIVSFSIFSFFLSGGFVKSFNKLMSLNLEYFLIFITIFVFTDFCFTEGWRVLLKNFGYEPNFFDTFLTVYAGKAIAQATPSERFGGSPVKSLLAKMKWRVPYNVSITSLIAQAYWDVPVFLSLLSIATTLYGYWFDNIYYLISIFCISSSIVLIYIGIILSTKRFGSKKIKGFVSWLGEKFGWGDGDDFVDNLYDNWTDIESDSILKVILWSFLTRLFSCIGLYVIFYGLGYPLPIYAPLLVVTLTSFLNAVPSLPGGPFIVEGGKIGLLILLGVPSSIALVGVLIKKSVSIAMGNGFGTLVLYIMSIRNWGES